MNKLERNLRRIVEQRLEEGWVLAPGQYLNRSGMAACCALGAVVAGSLRSDYLESDVSKTIEKRLSITQEQRWAIVSGFDGKLFSPDNAGYRKEYAIGARIRRDYYVTG
jgi:hypothetical protein